MSYRALDLFCGAGGAAKGLDDALNRNTPEWKILGVDINPMPRYPYDFVRGDAVEYLKDLAKEDSHYFDFIWASPPCQKYSKATAQQRNKGVVYPDLIAPVREILQGMNVPYVIENVPGAPLEGAVRLCGQMFGLRLLRHRFFEANFPITEPPHTSHKLLTRGVDKDYICAVKNAFKASIHKDYRKATWEEAMDINWMTVNELSEAVPPAYAEYIADQWQLHKFLMKEKKVDTAEG